MNKEQATAIFDELKKSSKIVIVQADNPDADSLGSALALEDIVASLDKEVYLYCGVDIPTYLHYLEGWSRVSNQLPSDFDTSIIVDASTETLLELIKKDHNFSRFQASTRIVIDHHRTTQNLITSAINVTDDSGSSTAELIYQFLILNNLLLSPIAATNIMCGILGDTQGLSNNLAKPETYRTMATLLESGANREKLEEDRRQYNKLAEKIYRYKASLIERTKLSDNGNIASVIVRQSEINEYSPIYNPAALIQPDMLMIDGVKITIIFKSYSDGRVTGAIRSNNGYPICGTLAEIFGGGGHDYASGFKITKATSIQEVEMQVIKEAEELLANGTM